MSAAFQKVCASVERGEVRISVHGYNELAEDNILIRDVTLSISDAVVVEDYPEYYKGPCVLVLHEDLHGKPIHVVWGDTQERFFAGCLDHSLSTRSR